MTEKLQAKDSRNTDIRASLRSMRDRLAMRNPFAAPPEVYQPIEGAVRGALQPVEPPAGFREHLRGNLGIALERKASGLVVERVKPFRAGIIIGVSAGIATALIAALILLLRPHSLRSQN